MAYQLILWDVDDTLLDFQKSERQALTLTFKDYHLSLMDSTYQIYTKINEDYWKQLEKGIYTRDQICQMRFKDLINLNLLPNTINVSDFNKTYFSHLTFMAPPMPHASYVIHTLRKRHYKLAIISNGVARMQYTRLKKAKLFKHFDHLFISQTCGYQKPDPRFMDCVYKYYPNISKKDMLIIGDSLSSDMMLAQNCGIDSIWYNPHHKNQSVKSTYTIDNLTQILDILK